MLKITKATTAAKQSNCLKVGIVQGRRSSVSAFFTGCPNSWRSFPASLRSVRSHRPGFLILSCQLTSHQRPSLRQAVPFLSDGRRRTSVLHRLNYCVRKDWACGWDAQCASQHSRQATQTHARSDIISQLLS